MAAITAPRAGSVRVVNRDKRPLRAGVKVFKGGMASVDAAGNFGPATGATTEILVGTFYETVDNTAGIAGAKLADIQYDRERTLRLWDNDAGGLVTTAMRELLCSILDDHTVTLKVVGKSSAGVVYDVTTEGVWVEQVYPARTAVAV